MQMKIKKLRDPGILKAKKKLDFCEGSPFSGTVLYYYRTGFQHAGKLGCVTLYTTLRNC